VTFTVGAGALSITVPGCRGVSGDRFTFAPGNTANELSRWISVDRPNLTLPPWSRTQVRATVTVPRHVSSGERPPGAPATGAPSSGPWSATPDTARWT
jgi:hypothetical protein